MCFWKWVRVYVPPVLIGPSNRRTAEAEACDLVMEIERLDLLEKFVEKDDFPRVCLYLVRYASRGTMFCRFV